MGVTVHFLVQHQMAAYIPVRFSLGTPVIVKENYMYNIWKKSFLALEY